MIQGDVGEGVDLVLGDLEPLAGAFVGSDVGLVQGKCIVCGVAHVVNIGGLLPGPEKAAGIQPPAEVGGTGVGCAVPAEDPFGAVAAGASSAQTDSSVKPTASANVCKVFGAPINASGPRT